MKEFLPVIKSSPLFSNVSEADIETLLSCQNAKVRAFAKNGYLFHAGEHTQDLGMLLRGSVQIIQEDFWGNRNLLAKVRPGQIFAESFACIPSATLNVSVVAEEPSCALFLNASRLLAPCPAACAFHGNVVQNLLRDLAGKNLRLNEKLTHMSQRTTRDKLLSYLSAEALRKGGPSFDIPFNRQQLADYLCVERSAMSKALCVLRDEGVIRFSKNRFELVKEN